MIDTAIIEKEAMQLPEAERALLADRLIRSLAHTPDSLRDAWMREAESRLAAYRDGKVTAVKGPQAIAELRTRLSR
jgi:putative addiction module component (TIGR02574 family)